VYLQCTCSVPAVYLQYTCSVPAVYLQCTCSVPAVYLQYTCGDACSICINGKATIIDSAVFLLYLQYSCSFNHVLLVTSDNQNVQLLITSIAWSHMT